MQRFLTGSGQGWSLFWVLHVAYWLFVWLSGSLLVRIFRPAVVSPERSVAIHVVTAFLATAALCWLLQRQGFMQRTGLSPMGLVIGGVITVAVAQTLVDDRLLAVIGLADSAPSRARTIAMFLVRLATLLGWALSYLLVRLLEDHRLTTLQAVEALAEADRNELRHLQAQMDPHFLFNALNAVLACKDDPAAVETVTQSLAEYLRFCLRDTAPLEPLGREIDALGKYLTVQEMRFGDDLECTIDCERRTREILVPPMLVQPLLENALKYGPATSPLPLRVTVTARMAGDFVEVEVANGGRWVAADPARSPGIGLRSLRRRLAMFYGAEASVDIDASDGQVRVIVRLPATPVPGAWKRNLAGAVT